jgi:hypothetical protein
MPRGRWPRGWTCAGGSCPRYRPLRLRVVGYAPRNLLWERPNAQALDLRGKEAADFWDDFAGLLNTRIDPNWRNRPSILDQMRGWVISPARKKRAKPPSRIAPASAP